MKGVFLYLFIFCSVKSYGQNQFYNFYLDTIGIANVKAIPTHDNGFIVLQNTGSKLALCKFDSIGFNSWSKNYSVPSHNLYGGDIKELISHDIYVSGILSDGNNFSTYALMQMDSMGNLLSATMDQDSVFVNGNPYGAVVMPGQAADGGVIFAGLMLDSVQHRNIFLAKGDSSGNPQWFRFFEPDTNTYCAYIRSSKTTNGEILITGFFQYVSMSTLTYFFIAKFDSTGNLIWSKHGAAAADVSEGESDEAVEMNGDLYILTVQDTPSAFQNICPHIYKISSGTGELEWHTHYNGIIAGWSTINNSLKDYSNRISFTVRDGSNTLIQFEIDSAGSMVNGQTYGNLQYSTIFFNTLETASHKKISYGFGYDFWATSTGLLFATVDSEYRTTCYSSDISLSPPQYNTDSMITSGTAYSGSVSFTDFTSYVQTSSFILTPQDFCNLVSINENEIEGKILLFPNPCFSNARLILPDGLENATVSIYDETGRVILFQSGIESDIDLNVEKFSKGIYILRVRSEAFNKVIRFVKM
jgi:hypothetical protein